MTGQLKQKFIDILSGLMTMVDVIKFIRGFWLFSADKSQDNLMGWESKINI